MDFKNLTSDLTRLRVLLPVSKLLHCYCSKTKHFCCCFLEWIQIVNIIYVIRLILKRLRKKEDRKTFSGKKRALFSLKKGTNKLCCMFLTKWKDTMFFKIRLYGDKTSLIHKVLHFMYTAFTKNLSSQESILCLSGLLEHIEGTYGENFWTINQILAHQSNLCNVNTDPKSKLISWYFISVICNIIYFQILRWKCF